MMMTGSYMPASTNKKLYNAGSEWQDDIEGLADYYSTFYREYDPVIGRFNGVDPMSESFESWTTYHYSYNNPINFNDPMGDYAATTASGQYFQNILDYVSAWGVSGLGNFTATYSDDGGGSGGGGNGSIESLNVDNPVGVAVFGLHSEWGVTLRSLGGAAGFNMVVYNVISGGGATMNFMGNPFSNLTAGETVRQQVKENNFDDALNTINKAYPLTIGMNKDKYNLEWSEGYSHNVNPSKIRTSKGDIALMNLSKLFFKEFANASATDQFHTFGALVREVHHEFVHVSDVLNLKGQYITNNDAREVNAYYHMFMDPGMPPVTQIYQYRRWSDAIDKYYNSPNMTPQLKNQFAGYYNTMQNFIDNYKKKNKIK